MRESLLLILLILGITAGLELGGDAGTSYAHSTIEPSDAAGNAILFEGQPVFTGDELSALVASELDRTMALLTDFGRHQAGGFSSTELEALRSSLAAAFTDLARLPVLSGAEDFDLSASALPDQLDHDLGHSSLIVIPLAETAFSGPLSQNGGDPAISGLISVFLIVSPGDITAAGVSIVPEPASLMLMGTGLLGLTGWLRRGAIRNGMAMISLRRVTNLPLR